MSDSATRQAFHAFKPNLQTLKTLTPCLGDSLVRLVNLSLQISQIPYGQCRRNIMQIALATHTSGSPVGLQLFAKILETFLKEKMFSHWFLFPYVQLKPFLLLFRQIDLTWFQQANNYFTGRSQYIRANSKLSSVLTNNHGVFRGLFFHLFYPSHFLRIIGFFFKNMQMTQTSATPFEILMIFPLLTMLSRMF